MSELGRKLNHACDHGRLEEARSAVERGGNPNWKNYSGDTALMKAALNGHTAIVQYLVERTTAQVNATDNRGNTALMKAARRGHTAIVQYLVERTTAQVNATNNDGCTALMEAAQDRRTAIVQYLVERTTAQVNAIDNDGRTALMMAALYGHTAIVQYLVERTTAQVNATDNGGRTALMIAAKYGCTAIVQYLVERTTARVNATDNDGRTALMWAARCGHTAIVQYLVERTTAQVNATDSYSWTACHYAARHGRLEVIKLLVAHGANIQLRNKDGNNPLDLAEQHGCQSVVDYLVTLEETISYTKLVQKAMREGRTKLLIIKALITGLPGVGKTCIRHLLLGLPPPPSRTSTPLATQATRAISFYRIKVDGSGDVTWTELDDDTYLKYIAEEVKMIELNPSHSVPSQPATTTSPTATESEEQGKNDSKEDINSQEPSDVDHTPPVLSPATPLVFSSSPEERIDDANPLPVPPKVEGIASDVVNKLITNPDISKENNKKKTFVHLIDSGGQPSFISLVPAFVRGSTVNIVASKLNHSINDKLQYEYVKDDQHLRKPTQLEKSQLEFIEELIRTLTSVKHSKEASGQGSSEPKFLLIGTHADKHWSLFDQTLSGKNRWLKNSLGELKSMCIKVNHEGDILLPINTRVMEGRSEVASSLRQKIIEACSNAEVEIPTRWYVFELEVSGKAKKEGRSVLGLAECIEVGGTLGMGEEDVIAALAFLDGAALCLYFQAAAPHLVFTDSQAILSEVTEILNLGIIDLHFIPSHYPGIDKLREQGLFSKELVNLVCSKYRVNEEGKCIYSVNDFLSILQHLLIIAPVCINEVELFFIPSILPTSKNISPLAGELAPLVLLCRTRAIPLGMFSALIVALFGDKLFSLDEIIGCNAISLECKVGGGVVLLVECHAWLTVHFNGHPSAAPLIRAAIHRAIATVCRQRHLDTKQIVFSDGFFCPFKICESTSHACLVDTTFSPARLTCSVRPKIGCGPCSDERMLAWLDASTVSVSSATTTTSQSPPPTVSLSASATTQSPSITNSSPPPTVSVSASVTAHSSSTSRSSLPSGTDTVSQFQFLEAVASKIPAKWRKVGLSLGIGSSILDGIERHRRGDCLECFSDVFTYWQEQSTPQSPANWASIVAVLRSNYVGEEKLSDTIRNTFM